jgi:hypothetical protein
MKKCYRESRKRGISYIDVFTTHNRQAGNIFNIQLYLWKTPTYFDAPMHHHLQGVLLLYQSYLPVGDRWWWHSGSGTALQIGRSLVRFAPQEKTGRAVDTSPYGLVSNTRTTTAHHGWLLRLPAATQMESLYSPQPPGSSWKIFGIAEKHLLRLTSLLCHPPPTRDPRLVCYTNAPDDVCYFLTTRHLLIWEMYDWHLYFTFKIKKIQTVSLEFFIDIILPIALWPCGRLSL